jgi:gentisate 1,2-dioxygenase
MSIRSGNQLPYPEFRARHAKGRSAPVVWQWKTLADALGTAEHSERGTIALTMPDGDTEVVPGTAVAFQVITPGGRTTSHAHTWWHLYVVRSGTGTVVFDELDETADLNPGDIMLIPAWSMHHFENRGGSQDLVLLNLMNLPHLADLGNLLSEEMEAVDGTA